MGVIDIYNKIGNTNELNEPTLVDAIKNSGGSGVQSWTKLIEAKKALQEFDLPREFNELLVIGKLNGTYTNSVIVGYIPKLAIKETGETEFGFGGAKDTGSNSIRVNNTSNKMYMYDSYFNTTTISTATIDVYYR